jgi:hypothetical protein
MSTPQDTLELYVRYQDYLTASQLRDLLGHTDRLYDAIYSGVTHTDPRHMALQSRLRVSELRTGQSITLLLVEGITAMMKAGAIVKIPAAIGALSVAARILISSAKGAVEVRKTWHEGTKAKYEGEIARQEARGHRTESQPPQPDLRTVPDEAKLAAANSATQMINLIEYSPNIVCFKVNGEVVINKQIEESSHH